MSFLSHKQCSWSDANRLRLLRNIRETAIRVMASQLNCTPDLDRRLTAGDESEDDSEKTHYKCAHIGTIEKIRTTTRSPARCSV